MTCRRSFQIFHHNLVVKVLSEGRICYRDIRVIDKMSSSGKCLFFFLKKPFEKFLSPQRPSLQNQVSTVAVEMEKLDVIQEV